MLKPSIPETVTFVAENLHAREAAIRDLRDESTTAIRLFTWHLLAILGHSADSIAEEFETDPTVIERGLRTWRDIIRRHHGEEPEVTQRILAVLKDSIPAATH